MQQGTGRPERGAVAVEMAIVLPLLLLVLGGVIDFGRLFMAEIMVTNAAREGARMTAMGYNSTDTQTRVTNSMPGLADMDLTPEMTIELSCPSAPAITDVASVRVRTTNFDWIIVDAVAGFFGGATPVTQAESTATMRCLG